ncbi:hypothetical protein ACQQCD_07485 [Pseudarthrobacter sp. J1763]|uniref:hypothetical protein n=1 Tax=Pseudarthrobacter sp. J1763 TaxID=3420445 RepID=UPI003D2AB3F6
MARFSALRAATVVPITALLLGAGLSACSVTPEIKDVDVPAWQATAMPQDPASVVSFADKLLNRDPSVHTAANVSAGKYVLTITCEGTGKAFFLLESGSATVHDAGAACNGNKEIVPVTLPSGTLKITATTVDAPLLFAYKLVPAK